MLFSRLESPNTTKIPLGCISISRHSSMVAGLCIISFFHTGNYGGSTRICQSNNIQPRRNLHKMKCWRNINVSGIGRCSQRQLQYRLLDLRNLRYILGMKDTVAASSHDAFLNSSEDDEQLRVEEGVGSAFRGPFKLPKQWWKAHVMSITGILMCLFLVVPSADAVDVLKTYACLMKGCRVELAKCIANPSCVANIACLETCHGRPDEAECEIRCGDLFENKVVAEFNQCAVSRKKCIPRIPDGGEFPVPDPSALVKSFNISDFSGKWYITSGLSPTFDIYDCQFQEFHVESEKLVGNLSWRIRTPDGCFFTRTTVQSFVQDPLQPAILYNHDNEYLNYRDNWYILSSKIENKDDDYIFVYYRGSNDAWDGYGGAVVYTRSAVLPDTIIPELEKAANSVGRDFSKFIRTDNSCSPEPSLAERIGNRIGEGKKTIIREVEKRTETHRRIMEAKRDADNLIKGFGKEGRGLLDALKMEASKAALSVRKLR